LGIIFSPRLKKGVTFSPRLKKGVTFSLSEWLRLDKSEMILGYRFGMFGLKLVLGVEFHCGVEKL
jgi:hypothetical protein